MQSPSTYETLNNELKQRYVIIVDEIVKTYPNYKASPKAHLKACSLLDISYQGTKNRGKFGAL